MFTANQIDSRVYLGNLQAALNLPTHITHVLTVLNFEPLLKEDDKLTRLHINAHDLISTDLLSEFEQCYEFITKALEENDINQVLIHCYAGKSRSATIALMYLMKKYNYTYDQAEKHLKRRRPEIMVNEGFQNQLQLFFDLNYNLDKTHQRYVSHRLDCLRLQYIETYGYEAKRQLKDQFLAMLPSDNDSSPYYECKQCNTKLFNEENVIQQDLEKSLAWTTYLRWIVKQFGPYARGDLKCPKCDAKLGKYQLDGFVNKLKQASFEFVGTRMELVGKK